ncbi:MAG: hypothetical protein LIP23_07860 [Planctomycetes bacterium]|nr:hypothetical protein [Planctomycetota bacterium]
MWDKETMFSDKQALTDGAVSTSVVDAGPDDIGLGGPIYLQVALSNASEAELTVTVNTADAETMANPVDVAVYKVPAATAARGGIVLAAPMPTGCRRYLRLAYAGQAAGTVTAGLVESAQTSGMR